MKNVFHHRLIIIIILLRYLEHKKLLSEDGQSVEASVADVGLGVGVGGLGPLRWAVRARVAVVLAWV